MSASLRNGIYIFICILICLLIFIHIKIDIKLRENDDCVDNFNNDDISNTKQIEKIVEKCMNKKEHKYKKRIDIFENMTQSAFNGLLGGIILNKNITDSVAAAVTYSVLNGLTSSYKMYNDIKYIKN